MNYNNIKDIFQKLPKKAMINEPEVRNAKKGYVLDCREPEEFATFHLDNAINAPMVGLIENPQLFIKDKTQTTYIYCHSGNRARTVCSRLEQKGYTNCINVGGIIHLDNN